MTKDNLPVRGLKPAPKESGSGSFLQFISATLGTILVVAVVCVVAFIILNAVVGSEKLKTTFDSKVNSFLIDKSLTNKYGVEVHTHLTQVKDYESLSENEKEVLLPASDGAGTVYYYNVTLDIAESAGDRTDGFKGFLVDNGTNLICYDDLWCKNYDNAITDYLEDEIGYILSYPVYPLNKSHFSKFFASTELETGTNLETLQEYYLFGDEAPGNPLLETETGMQSRIMEFIGTYMVKKDFVSQNDFKLFLSNSLDRFTENGIYGTFLFVPQNHSSVETGSNDWTYEIVSTPDKVTIEKK